MSKAQHLRKGTYYNIINMKTNMALSMPKTNKFTKDKPEFKPLDAQDNNQLWMVEEVQNEKYEIVHALSTLVLECIGGTNVSKLEFGKQKGNQMFFLEHGEELEDVKKEASNAEDNERSHKSEKSEKSEKPKMEEEEERMEKKSTGSSQLKRRQNTIKTKTYVNLCPSKKVSLKFRFKQKQSSNKVLFCDTSKATPSLKFMELDSSIPDVYLSSLWELLPVKIEDNQLLSSLCFISSYRSGYVLDVPEATEKQGTQIIQYPCNSRFNQAWIFKKVEQLNGYSYYQISNAKTGLFLDIKGQMTKEGSPVIQWENNSGRNQIWRLEEQGKRVYLIRSALDLSLLMGVKDNSLKESAEIVTSKIDTESFWVIHGNIPE